MLAHWYLHRRLRDAWPAEGAGVVPNVPSLIALAQVKQFIFLEPTMFYVGKPLVRQFFAVHDQTFATKQHVMHVAASLAQRVSDPFFAAIVKMASETDMPLREVEVDQISPIGYTARLDRTWFILGDAACLQQEAVELGVSVHTIAQRLAQEGNHVFFLAQKQPKRLLGIFACAHPLRAEAPSVVTALQEKGIATQLLTELPSAIASGIADFIGISLTGSDLVPLKKEAMVRALFEGEPASMLVREGVVRRQSDPSMPLIIVGKSTQGIRVTEPSELVPLISTARSLVSSCQKKFFWTKL